MCVCSGVFDNCGIMIQSVILVMSLATGEWAFCCKFDIRSYFLCHLLHSLVFLLFRHNEHTYLFVLTTDTLIKVSSRDRVCRD